MRQLFKRGCRRPDAKINLSGYTGLGPVGFADRSPLFADVTRDELAFREEVPWRR